MVHLIDEYIFKKVKKYTFKYQLFWNNDNKLVFCLVAVKNGKIECLDENLSGFTDEYKNKVINEYLIYKGVK